MNTRPRRALAPMMWVALCVGCGVEPEPVASVEPPWRIEPIEVDPCEGAARAICDGLAEQVVVSQRIGRFEQFGRALDIDGEAMIVGAGAVQDASQNPVYASYVVERAEGEWFVVHPLRSGSELGTRFGSAVAIEGDVAVVGAPGMGRHGAAFVYEREARSWSLITILHGAEYYSGESSAGLAFGAQVAVDAGRVIVSAPSAEGRVVVRGEQGNRFERFVLSGEVFTFTRGELGWEHAHTLRGTAREGEGGPQDGARFGEWVAAHQGRLAVASPGLDPWRGAGAAGSLGVVDVYTWRDGAWVEPVTLSDPAPPPEASRRRFGAPLALHGDTLAVASAPPSGRGDLNALVQLFTLGGERASHDQTLAYAHGGAAAAGDDRFGASLALHEGVLAVGAPGEDGSGSGLDPEPDDLSPGSGAVFVYALERGAWSEAAYVKPREGQADSGFGRAVALDDGALVVGAPGADLAGAASAGVVFVY
jgi:hypothetical protein